MRQRPSTKTQRRLKQQQMCSPYTLTDPCETPTFRVGGLVTAVGVLRLVVALALSGFVFSGALVFCIVLLVTLGVTLLHHSDTKTSKQRLGLKHAINRLLALRRSALDYSLTLSIAQSDEYKQPPSNELQIAVVSSSPTPQKVVATMALEEEKTLKTRQNRKTKSLSDIGSIGTFNRVKLMPLPTISLLSIETNETLIMEKFWVNPESEQVLQTRPLLPLKAKVQNLGSMQEKTTQERPTSTVLKTVAKHEKKTTHVQVKAKMTQSQQATTAFETSKVSTKKQIQLPAVLSTIEPKVVIPAVPLADLSGELPMPKIVDVIPPTTNVAVNSVARAVASLLVLPEYKSLMEVVHGKATIERDLVVTRKVLIYLKSNAGSVVNLEEQDLEQDLDECEETLELEDELEYSALSLEAFPPLSPPMVPQVSMMLPTDVVEPNFLMDIELEPISKPEKNLVTPSSLHLKSVSNVDLRLMMDELDAMRLELDAAMACCTLLLHEGEKVSALT